MSSQPAAPAVSLADLGAGANLGLLFDSVRESSLSRQASGAEGASSPRTSQAPGPHREGTSGRRGPRTPTDGETRFRPGKLSGRALRG